MTISNESIKTTVRGNGVQTTFSYNFLIPSASAAELYLLDTVTGGTILLPASSWQLTGAGNPAGGTFLYPRGSGSGPATSTQTLTLVRAVPYTQNTNLGNQNAYYPRAVEAALDWIVMQIQQNAALVQRSVRGPVTEGAMKALPARAQRANHPLAFDANGDPIALAGVIDPGLVIVSTFAATVLDDTDAAAMRATLAVSPAVQHIAARADIPAATVPASVAFIRTAGYAAAGDGGAALYVRAAALPVHGGTVQSGDGAWWELAPQPINVAMFGARPNGTNARTAFQAALDYIAAVFAEGAALHVPAGDWLIAGGTVLCDHSGTVILGASDAGTRIINGNAAAPAIQMGTAIGTRRNRMAVRNLIFGAASGVVSATGSAGLRVQNVNSFHAEAIEAYNFPAALQNGFEFVGCAALTIDVVSAQGCLGVGQFYENCIDVRFICARSDANQDGFQFQGVEGVYGANVTAYGNSRFGMMFRTHVSRPNKNWFITGWLGDTSGSNNWDVADLQTATLVACWGSTQISQAVNPLANGFLLYSSKVKNIWFMGGHAANNNGNGVTLFDPGGGGGVPRDVEFHGFNFGLDEVSDIFPNGRGGAGVGLSAAAACVRVRVFGGVSRGNPTGAFGASGIEKLAHVNGHVNERRLFVTGSTDGSGDITFSHGMNETPETVVCSFEGTTAASGQATNKTSTQVTVRIMNAAGGAMTSASVSFTAQMWGARA